MVNRYNKSIASARKGAWLKDRMLVDGQERETTPFARPIRLSPGTHYVRLEHPNAAPERRTLSLGAGESVLLEIDMKIALPSGSAPQARPSGVGAEGDDPSSP